jgi:hypothetical protein
LDGENTATKQMSMEINMCLIGKSWKVIELHGPSISISTAIISYIRLSIQTVELPKGDHSNGPLASQDMQRKGFEAEERRKRQMERDEKLKREAEKRGAGSGRWKPWLEHTQALQVEKLHNT